MTTDCSKVFVYADNKIIETVSSFPVTPENLIKSNQVLLRSKDKKEYLVDKDIALAKSGFLRTLFSDSSDNPSFTETVSHVVDLEDIESGCLETGIMFMYRGNDGCVIDKTKTCELLEMADFLNM